MKRLFTLFAAMCCVVSVALAEFSDGVKIYINGDEVPASEQTCFQSAKILYGHMSYDPTYHILHMVQAQIGITTAGTPALMIEAPDKADFTVTILLSGESGSILTSSGTNAPCMQVDCPLEIRGYGLQLTCTGTKWGILLNDHPLTVTGGVTLQAQGAEYGICGDGVEHSTLKIEHGNLKAITTKDNTSSTKYACVSGVKLELDGSVITSPSGAKWSEEKDGAIVTYDDKYVTKNTVEIKQQNDQLYVYPTQSYIVYSDLYYRVGKYSITKGGEAQPNPTAHMSGDKFTVTLEEGPEGKVWEHSVVTNSSAGYNWTGDAPNGEIEVTSTTKEKAFARRTFFRDVALKNKMYMLFNTGGSAALYESSNLNTFSNYMPALPSSVDNATNLTFANDGTDGAGNMYYSIEDGSKSQIKKVSWIVYKEDGSGAEVKDASTLQSTYYPFAGLCYNWVDGKLYGMAKKSDSKWYLVEVKPSTKAITEIGELNQTVSYTPIALACDKYGDLYCMTYKKEDPLLFKVDKSNGKMTLYSHPGFNVDLVNTTAGITTANMYKYHSMVFDYETNKLYWRGCYSTSLYYVVEIDMATGHADMVTTVGGSFTIHAIPGMFQELPKVYEITAKTAAGSYGTTLVEGKSSFKALDGSTVTLTATGDALEGTVFKQWKDGNKDNPRTVTVTEAATYEAEYWYGEGVETYPIWVCGKQFHANRLGFNSTNLSGKLTAGEIAYDPENKLLTLDKATMNISAGTEEIGILIGDENNSTELTIKSINNESAITGTLSFVPLRLVNAQVTMTGDKKMTFQSAGCGVSMQKSSTLKIEGAADVLLKGSYAVSADKTSTKLQIRGSKVNLDGGSKATYQLAEAEWEYVKPTPSDAYFNAEKGNFTKGESGAEQTDVTFAVDGYTVRCEPTEEGTGTFTLSDGNNTFENVGWFKNNTKVTLSTSAEDGYAFGYWTDDDKKEYSREITVTGDVTKQARFFRQAESSATWYGIFGGKLASFSIYEYGKAVVNPKTCFTVSGVKAGDYADGDWYYVDGTALKTWSFSGFDKDTEYGTVEKDAGVETLIASGVPSGITDYAYDLMGGDHYGVAGTDLYKVNIGDKKMEKIATLKNKYKEGGVEKTKTVTAVCIAIDPGSEIYFLSLDAILYKLKEIDDEKKEAWLEIVGDEKKGGNIKEVVANTQQSMAFDHVTGELFWASSDYIRLIDKEEMKCHIVADLGFKKGSAGVVKSMHRMDETAYIRAQVAEDCEGMGTVAVGENTAGEKSSGTYIAELPVKITANPAPGHKFVKWTILNGKKETEMKKNADKNPLEIGAYSVTFVAYFEETGEGIDSVESSEVSVQKVLIDGQIYIIKGEKMYNMTGNRVK